MEFFSKAGIIRLDFYTGEKRVKIYKDQNDKPKGDALISYQRPESVELAIEILDQKEILPGYKVHVEQAQFKQKGTYIER